MALMGHVFLNSPPPEYAWVQVVLVSDESCEIDITSNDGIELLCDTRNQYILWHHRDIILNASPNPLQPSQERVPPPPKIQMLRSSRTDNNLRWVGTREVTMRTTCYYHPSKKLSMKGHHHRNL
jgi:hypothetical protein